MTARYSFRKESDEFLSVSALYALVLLVEKTAECFFLSNPVEMPALAILGHGLFWGILFLIPLFLIHLLLAFILPRLASSIIVFLAALLLNSEIMLAIYSYHNGYLLDSELWSRPLSEIVQSVVGVAGVAVPIVTIILFIGAFMTGSILLMRRPRRWQPIMASTLFVLSIPLILIINNGKGNKTFFLLNSTIHQHRTKYMTEGNIMDFSPASLEAFHLANPSITPIQPEYPLERIDTLPSELLPYFQVSQGEPNVVILLVESLGMEMMPFAPFLDSLSHQSLFWSNCLSTTIRSFGALPAITASVGGPKSFQFGTMPSHNSLFTILKSNGYRTNAFYGGDFAFDCIYEYLQEQQTDYLSPFFSDFQKSKDNSLGNSWGYHDGTLLRETARIIAQQEGPQFNLITTLSTHENLDLSDKELTQQYYDKALLIAQQLSAEKQANVQEFTGRYASMLYADQCIRDFFATYTKLPQAANTIFVITGDHASGIDNKNRLSSFNVPLIIWSPMLKSAHHFRSITTHNDIAPALCRLLHQGFGITLPPTQHWLGVGLPTSSKAMCDRNMLVVSYNREMRELLVGNHLYVAANPYESESLYMIDTLLSLTPLPSADYGPYRQLLDSYRYIYQYTYYTDHLTSHPILPPHQLYLLHSTTVSSPVVCITPDHQPDEMRDNCNIYYLMKPTRIHSRKLDMVEISLEADITIHDSLWVDQYMDLVFFNGNGRISRDKVVKYFKENEIHAGKTYHLSLRKSFPFTRKSKFSVRIMSPIHNDQWVAGSSLTVEHAEIKVYGKK